MWLLVVGSWNRTGTYDGDVLTIERSTRRKSLDEATRSAEDPARVEFAGAQSHVLQTWKSIEARAWFRVAPWPVFPEPGLWRATVRLETIRFQSATFPIQRRYAEQGRD